jgi:hypothetical protein
MNETVIQKEALTNALSLLSEEDKEKANNILLKLGIVGKFKNKVQGPRIIKGKKVEPKTEYNLTNVIKCMTCSSVNNHHFFMKWDETSEMLIAYKKTRIEELDSSYEMKYVNTLSYKCSECDKALNNMTKEELIEHVLRLSNLLIKMKEGK